MSEEKKVTVVDEVPLGWIVLLDVVGDPFAVRWEDIVSVHVRELDEDDEEGDAGTVLTMRSDENLVTTEPFGEVMRAIELCQQRMRDELRIRKERTP